MKQSFELSIPAGDLPQRTPAVAPLTEELAAQPVAKDCEADDIASAMVIVISRVFRFCGRNIQGKELTLMADNLAEEVKSRFPELSAGEVERALFDGVREVPVGDYVELSARTFAGWLKAYRCSVLHNQTQRVRSEKQAPASPVITPEMNRTASRNLCVRAFEDYRKGCMLPGFAGRVFQALWDFRLLRLSPEYAADILSKARREVVAELEKRLASPIPRFKRNSLKRSLYAILDSEGVSPHEEVKTKAREIAVREYFDGLIQCDMQVGDEIDRVFAERL